MNLEIDGTLTFEGPGQSELTLRGEGTELVLSIPSAGQARRLLGRPEVRTLLRSSPAFFERLTRTGLSVKVEVGRTTIFDSHILNRWQEQG